MRVHKFRSIKTCIERWTDPAVYTSLLRCLLFVYIDRTVLARTQPTVGLLIFIDIHKYAKYCRT